MITSAMTMLPYPQNAERLSHPKYRADIDGLRAIAVLSVVGFHAFPFWIKGGFIGVDVFFVISGFLISTIIIGSLERNSFSFVEFYVRRINRIFPALFVVLIASLVFGWFVLFADEYKQLGKHIAGGAGFISNFLLWNESGYFDNASETKPLLHLWSLGIEEQFYIFWPLLLWFAWKLRLNLLNITIAIGILSFTLNIDGVSTDAVAAFFSPQTRFWELMAGSVLAFITLHKQSNITKFGHSLDTWLGKIIYAHAPEENGKTLCNVQSVLGVALISIGVLVITKERHFPGWWAVLPTFGTVLIISAGAQAWLNRAVLSSRVLVWFGLISFPLYLWHWPLLSFARIVEIGMPSPEIRIGVVFISIALAWLTYRLIERPIRLGKYRKTKTFLMVFLMITSGGTGYFCYKLNGFEDVRQPEKAQYISYFENSLPEWKYFTATDIPEKFRLQCDFYDLHKYRIGQATRIPLQAINKSCFERSSGYSKSIFIWGDSHAQMLYSGLKNYLPRNWQILQVASSGCAPNANVTEPSTTDYCIQSNWFALKAINQTKPDVVIVAQDRGHTIRNFDDVSKKLKSLGVNKIIITGPSPHWTTSLPKIIVRRLWENTPRRTYIGIDRQMLKDNLSLQEKFHNSEERIFVNIIGLFCNQEGCLTYIGDDKKTGISTWDYGHLTPAASNLLAENLLAPIITGENAHIR